MTEIPPSLRFFLALKFSLKIPADVNLIGGELWVAGLSESSEYDEVIRCDTLAALGDRVVSAETNNFLAVLYEKMVFRSICLDERLLGEESVVLESRVMWIEYGRRARGRQGGKGSRATSDSVLGEFGGV